MFLRALIFLLLAPAFYLSYNAYDFYDIGEYKVEVGMINNHLATDGYLRIYNRNSDALIQEVFYDSGENDIFKYIADIGDEYFLVVNEVVSHENIELGLSFQYTSILKYDFSGELIDTLRFEEEAIGYLNINEILVVQFSDEYRYIDKNLNFISGLGIEDTYLGEFSLKHRGDLDINNEVCEFVKINYPGNYSIKITDGKADYNLSIVVEADYMIAGERLGESYKSPVKIYSFGDMNLNGKEYSSGDLIKTVGNNRLVISGLGGYNKTVEFTIDSDTTVFDGENYLDLKSDFHCDYPIRIFSDSLYMEINNEFYNSTLIDSPGYYLLDIHGINEYNKEIEFVIWPKIEGLGEESAYETLNLNIFGKARINGEIVSGKYETSVPGNYTIELLMVDEVWQTYELQIVQIEMSSVKPNLVFLKYLFLGLSGLGLFLFLRKK